MSTRLDTLRRVYAALSSLQKNLPAHMFFESAAEYEKVKTFAVEANEQNFDRLEAQLAKGGLSNGTI